MLKLDSIFLNNEIKKYGYNLKDDYIFLKLYNINLENMYFDIIIVEYLIDLILFILYDCSVIVMKYLLKKVKLKEELLGKGVKFKNYEDLEFEDLVEYMG